MKHIYLHSLKHNKYLQGGTATKVLIPAQNKNTRAIDTRISSREILFIGSIALLWDYFNRHQEQFEVETYRTYRDMMKTLIRKTDSIFGENRINYATSRIQRCIQKLDNDYVSDMFLTASYMYRLAIDEDGELQVLDNFIEFMGFYHILADIIRAFENKTEFNKFKFKRMRDAELSSYNIFLLLRDGDKCKQVDFNTYTKRKKFLLGLRRNRG